LLFAVASNWARAAIAHLHHVVNLFAPFDPVRALVERRAAGWSRSRVRAGEQRQFCGRILNLAGARRD
jgi:hypothetical protein